MKGLFLYIKVKAPLILETASNSELPLLLYSNIKKFVISCDKAICRNIVFGKLKENGGTFSDSGLSRVEQELILN